MYAYWNFQPKPVQKSVKKPVSYFSVVQGIVILYIQKGPFIGQPFSRHLLKNTGLQALFHNK